ncbi:MAG: hypothetical protein LCH61_07295, partial [Proteobacteria bacterium]|nr:hypothetical protein [Pseudomonadota bacterium]
AAVHAASPLFRGAGYTAFDGEAPEKLEQAAVAAPYAHATAPLRRLVDRFVLVTCHALLNHEPVPSWVRDALPTLPKLMARSDGVSSRLERASVDAIEAALLVPMVGRHLTPVSALRNEAEARFRSALIRSREAVERSEGDMAERKDLREGLLQSYRGVVVCWTELVRQHVRLTWLTNSNSALTPILPLILGAPGILTDQLTIGQIVQLALAFTQVQVAIGWLVDNYMRIAEWRASAIRIITMSEITGEGEDEAGETVIAGDAAPTDTAALAPTLPQA